MEEFLHCMLDVAEEMTACGAEVNRIEDTLVRLGLAYGASRMNVFVITSSIVITMDLPDGRHYTQSRRILHTGGTDFKKLEAINELSRQYCADLMPTEQLHEELHRIEDSSLRRRYFYLGSVLAAGAFAVFFGGGSEDGIMAACFAVLICVLQERLMPVCMNKVTFNLLCSFVVGLGICMVSGWIPVLQEDKIMIGDIMLLIPGIAMTNAVRDILVGDTITGVMRLVETFLWAGALACGFMLAIWMTGG